MNPGCYEKEVQFNLAKEHKSRHKHFRAHHKRSAHTQNLSDNKALVIFMLLLAVVLVLMSNNSVNDYTVEQDRNTLVNKLVSSQEKVSIVDGGAVDDNKLRELLSLSYPELKQELGVKSDFAIYFEDGEGNIIEVLDTACIGSENVKVNGQKCGK